MNAATITALCTGIGGVITAVVSLVHALQAKNTAYNAAVRSYNAINAVKNQSPPKEGASQ